MLSGGEEIIFCCAPIYSYSQALSFLPLLSGCCIPSLFILAIFRVSINIIKYTAMLAFTAFSTQLTSSKSHTD